MKKKKKKRTEALPQVTTQYVYKIMTEIRSRNTMKNKGIFFSGEKIQIRLSCIRQNHPNEYANNMNHVLHALHVGHFLSFVKATEKNLYDGCNNPPGQRRVNPSQ